MTSGGGKAPVQEEGKITSSKEKKGAPSATSVVTEIRFSNNRPPPPRSPIASPAKTQSSGIQSFRAAAPSDDQENNVLRQSLEFLLKDGGPAAAANAQGQMIFANEAYRRLLPLLLQGTGAMRLETASTSLLPRVQEIIAETEGFGRGWSPEINKAILLREQGSVMGSFAVLRDDQNQVKAVVLRCQVKSNQQEMRRQLSQLNERFEDIARLVSDWVWETDRNLKITYISHRVQEALGYPTRALQGRPLVGLFQESGVPLQRVLESEAQRPFRSLELKAVHQSGELRLFMLSGVPVFSTEDGAFLGYRGTAQDTTNLKARESALVRSKELAEGANKAKSEFLATVSHELRTPLNAIIGFSELMNKETYGSLGHPNYVEYNRDIYDSAHHLLAIINDILDISKIEAGKLVLDDQEVDVLTVALTTLRLVAKRAKDNQINLMSDLPDSLPFFRGDARALRQVLLNLLSNAIKFTPEGGEVHFSTQINEAGDLVFKVRDTGIGMAEADIKTALTPFGQVDSRLSRRFEGTGLGLPLSKGLTELHGGTLTVTSALNKGTTVMVILPAQRVCE